MSLTATAEHPGSDKREAILSAALGLFAAQGFHGTAMPEVAAQAKVGAGTIYRYFDSKEALVNALFRQWKLELGARLMGGVEPELPLPKAFHHVFTQLVRFAQECPEAFAFLELHHHAPYLDAQSLKVESDILEALAAWVQAGSEAKMLKALPPALLLAIAYGAISGLLKAVSQGYLVLTPALMKQAEACVWESIAR